MKKAILGIIVIGVFSTLVLWAKETVKGNGNLKTIERTTATYDHIKLIGSPTIEIVDGKEGQLQISAEENLLEYIETEVKNGVLTVKMSNNTSISSTQSIKIQVPVQDVSRLTINGSGEIISKKTLDNHRLELELMGSGEMKLDVKCDNLSANLNGSGNITVAGNTEKLSGTVNGSGKIKADQLEAKHGRLNVNGSGNIVAQTSNEVSAHVSGSGGIKVEGNPSRIDKAVNGSGSVKIN